MPATKPAQHRDIALLAPIAEDIWRSKYRFLRPDGSGDRSLADTFARVAEAAASAEKGDKRRARWTKKFYEAMADMSFLPAGRILAGAGTGRDVTLFNCFVMGTIPDDLSGIFESVKEAALTMQAGGGVGMDFSTLRPRGALVRSIGADASGPVSFMEVWDAMCHTIMSAGARRGAMMATMRADHPDIETFIAAKAEAGHLENFNLSVLASDAFLAAVRSDGDWNLIFDGKVYRTIRARSLWEHMMQATYDYAEPGVIFIDRINTANNLSYCETISATNPCGEQPLPPYGACLLGSINLAALVNGAFTADARLDEARLEKRVATAVRFLDNIIDISHYPLDAQRQQAQDKRRIGLGITGLADALVFLGLRYDSEVARARAEHWMRLIQRAAYRASAKLAAKKGAFPLYDRDAILAAPMVAGLDSKTRLLIEKHGLRNGCLTSIAPTGTTSLLAGNVSSGIEPVFDWRYHRHMLDPDGTRRDVTVEDFAYAAFRRLHGDSGAGADAELPEFFVRAADMPPGAHLSMQAALQRHVDGAISKTINVPVDMSFADFEAVYLEADALGLKGCTTYRPSAVRGAVLEPEASAGKSSTAEQDLLISGPAAPAGASGAMHVVQGTAEARPSTEQVNHPPIVGTPASQSAGGAAGGGVAVVTGDVVYMSKPLEREAALSGFTYKLKWPASDHAIYVTLNDIEVAGRRRPFEIFINTRNLEHYAWTVALTRMISAVFRRGGDVTFVAEELKAVFDPQGGQWIGGRYVPSLLAAIGNVIERHMVEIGFLDAARASGGEPPLSELSSDGCVADVVQVEQLEATGRSSDMPVPAFANTAPLANAAPPTNVTPTPQAGQTPPAPHARDTLAGEARASEARTKAPPPPKRFCQRCSSPNLALVEGCWTCRDCGFSKCG